MTYTPEQQSIRQLALSGNIELAQALDNSQGLGVFVMLEEELKLLLDIAITDVDFYETDFILRLKGILQAEGLVIFKDILELPSIITAFNHFRAIRLEDNLLGDKGLEFVFTNMKYLVSVTLEKNNIFEISNSIKKCENLKSLYLHSNKISNFPMGCPPSLERVHLDRNKFTVFPENICDGGGINLLNFNHNEIPSIPPKISNMKNLQYLHLNSNRLESLPPEFSKLPSLIKVDFRFNKFTEIPRCLLGIPTLETILLFGNPMNFKTEVKPFEEKGIKCVVTKFE